MSTAERVRLLGSVPELVGLRDAARHFDEVRVPAGEVLAEEGALCHQYLVVAEGTLQTRRRGRTGELGPGDSFGFSAMRRRGVNPAGVVALTEARVLVMSHAQFRAAEALPPKKRLHLWALPSSHRSLPHRPNLRRA
jgi:CRP-like cAMP-binding protein